MVRLCGKSGIKQKSGQGKEKFFQYYQEHIKEIENNDCNFDIIFLAQQIKAECVYQNGGTFKEPDLKIWGGEDAKTYDYQTSLISRITDLVNTDIFSELLGFNGVPKKSDSTEFLSIIDSIESFLNPIEEKIKETDNILRISFENIPSSFSAKEIVSNALASYLLNKARKRDFIEDPVLLVIDEAHQFLNKNVRDDFFEIQSLDAFDLIAKECRKYGLFLCLATQIPRDIPIGTLSQMGTFIVHRLINEKDKQAIENAASSANKNALSFLPILGEGEALLVGVDFPMPLLIKIDKPVIPPKSETPRLKARNG